MTQKEVVVLGGGTGGTLAANRLRRRLDPESVAITVVDRDDRHLYQPGLLFVPFGMARLDRLVRPRRRLFSDGIWFHRASVTTVDVDRSQVHLGDGTVLGYDALVVATGAGLALGETEGLSGEGWMRNVFSFYEPRGAAALQAALATFDGGRVVVNVVDMPIKCPVAPLEFCFLADWYFHRRAVRNRVEITFVTPLDGAFTQPAASARLGQLLSERGITLVSEFNTGQVDGAGGRLVSYDGREVGFDLAVVVPLHTGAPFVADSPGLGDDLGFVPTDRATLQAKAAPNVFVIGDAADLPTSKAGSVTHFEGEILVDNVVAFLSGRPLEASFDGHSNCFVETGYHKALLIDFDYDTEPLPGRYPGRVGLPLMRESYANHLGKLAFEHLYWHTIVQGRDIPGIGSAMPTAGKVGLPAGKG